MDDIDRLLESPDSLAAPTSDEDDVDWMTSFSVRYEDWENEFDDIRRKRHIADRTSAC